MRLVKSATLMSVLLAETLQLPLRHKSASAIQASMTAIPQQVSHVCSSECVTCEAALTCLSCVDTEAELNNGVCTCRAGFYDVDDSTNLRCLPCNSQCLTCDASLECLSCVDRHAEAVFGVCRCTVGFVTGATGECVVCSEETFNASDAWCVVKRLSMRVMPA
jgi:hypothetical protein